MQHTRRNLLTTCAATLAGASLPGLLSIPAHGQAVGRPAPSWDILEWINGYGGNVDTLKGKVIIIDFFQLWCPGCNKFSGPLMNHWQQKFSNEMAMGQLVLVKIHTVFEGHNYQTVNKLKTYVKDKGITIPVGVDRHIGERRIPETMRRYKTRGTPEIVMIDRNGMVRFQRFGWFDPAAAESYLESLLGSSNSARRSKPVEICLASELCG